MKSITMFILHNCPYCKQALSWMEELKKEDPRYNNIDIKIIDEGKEPDLADKYDYYFVPTYYIGSDKVHEGAATKDKVKAVFDEAIE